MKKIIALAAIAAACSTSAFAQVSNFTGFNAAVNMTMNASSLHLADGSLADQSVGANLQAAYGYALNSNTVLTVGVTYGLTDDKAGTWNETNPVATNNAKVKKQSSIYIEPGFLITPTTLAYGKISFDSANFDVASTVADNSTNFDVNGVGYGIGLRTMIDKNLFLQVEAKQTSFNSTRPAGLDNDATLKSTVGSVGIGYKF